MNGASSRKESRKLKRTEKKQRNFDYHSKSRDSKASSQTSQVEAYMNSNKRKVHGGDEPSSSKRRQVNVESASKRTIDVGLKGSTQIRPPHISKSFEEDDELIRMYEKKLGIKSKKLPSAFKSDGLDCSF